MHQTQQSFFRADFPTVQSAVKLQQSKSKRNTLEPEKDRKVQGKESVEQSCISPASRNQSSKWNEVRDFQDSLPSVKAEL